MITKMEVLRPPQFISLSVSSPNLLGSHTYRPATTYPSSPLWPSSQLQDTGQGRIPWRVPLYRPPQILLLTISKLMFLPLNCA